METQFGLEALRDVRAVLFDLDGTLYRQSPVQKRMAMELLMLPVLTFSPTKTRRVWKVIKGYRELHEMIRDRGHSEESLHELQLDETARRTGIDPQDVREIVQEWMLRRPLPFVTSAMRPGLTSFLAQLEAWGLERGVLSDYPVEGKLNALGLGDAFSLQLCSSDAAINALKPHPRGMLHACERWGLQPHQVLYVGDRIEVDGAGARNAGMPGAIITTKVTGEWCFAGFDALQRTFEEHR